MTNLVNIADAKARLSELLERTAAGEEIVIAKAGKPLARLVPFEATPGKAGLFGALAHLGPVPDAALEPEPLDALYGFDAVTEYPQAAEPPGPTFREKD
jgi:prevent-host-death family protein